MTERQRLSRQCAAILARLQAVPVTNRELSADYSLKYTSRISELRQSGYNVQPVEHNRESGRVVYALLPPPETGQLRLFAEAS